MSTSSSFYDYTGEDMAAGEDTFTERTELCVQLPHQVTKDRAKQWLNDLSSWAHDANKKWWLDLGCKCLTCGGSKVSLGLECSACFGTGQEPKQRNVGELLMLCVSELSEALEGHRKNLPDDKLPHRRMFEVEIADCLVRIFDLCGGLKLDIGGAFVEKMAYNADRADHKLENRIAEGGKKY